MPVVLTFTVKLTTPKSTVLRGRRGVGSGGTKAKKRSRGRR